MCGARSAPSLAGHSELERTSRLHAWGSAALDPRWEQGTIDGPRSHAEGIHRRDRGPNETSVPPQGTSRRGPGSRAAPIPFQGRTQRYDAAAIWHSVGGKLAGDPRLWKCCKSDTRLVPSRASVISSACARRSRSFRGPSRTLDTQYCKVLPDGHSAASLSTASRNRTDDKTASPPPLTLIRVPTAMAISRDRRQSEVPLLCGLNRTKIKSTSVPTTQGRG